MPLANWIQCLDGDFTGCRKSEKGTDEQDCENWEIIYESYISEMGIDKTYKKILEIMKKKAIIQCDLVSTDDKFNLTLLQIEEENLRMIMNETNKSAGGIRESLVYLSKWLGSWLDAKQISVRDYFVLLSQMEKINKIQQ